MSFFHLLIEDAGSDSFWVSDRADPGSRTKVFFDRSDSDEGKKLTGNLGVLRSRGHEGPMSFKKQEPVAEAIGHALYETFLPVGSTVRARFESYIKQFPIPRLALHLPRTLFDVPWEVLKRPEELKGKFLSLMGSVVRCDHSPRDL